MYKLGLEEFFLVVPVTNRVCLPAFDFIGLKPSPEVKGRDLRSVNPVEVVVVDFFLDDLDRILVLKFAAQSELVLVHSHNVHLAILFIIGG